MTRTCKRTVARALLFAGGVVVTLALSALPASAKTDFGVRGGAYSNDVSDEPFVGAEALFTVGETHHWMGNPNLEHAFADTPSGDLTSVSFDFHYDFPTGSPYGIWAGAGPTLIFRDRNTPDLRDRDAGVNLLMGVGANRGDVRPYGQLKVVLSDDTAAVLGMGVRF
jgi:hypothetical protein